MFIRVTHCSLQQRVKRVLVDMHRYAGGWRHIGGIALCFFKGEQQRGQRCVFITVPFVSSWFIKIGLKQIYCSYSGTQKFQNDFL